MDVEEFQFGGTIPRPDHDGAPVAHPADPVFVPTQSFSMGIPTASTQHTSLPFPQGTYNGFPPLPPSTNQSMFGSGFFALDDCLPSGSLQELEENSEPRRSSFDDLLDFETPVDQIFIETGSQSGSVGSLGPVSPSNTSPSSMGTVVDKAPGGGRRATSRFLPNVVSAPPQTGSDQGQGGNFSLFG